MAKGSRKDLRVDRVSEFSFPPGPIIGGKEMAKIAVTGLRGVPATWGGVEHQCEQTYARLAARGHQVTIYARTHYVPEGMDFYRGMTVRRLPTINTRYTEAFVHTFLSVLDIIRTQPRIVHIYAQGPCLFSPLVRLFRPRIRIFFTCTGLDWQRKKWPRWASRVIRLGEVFSALFPHYRITVSKDLQNYYRTVYGVSTHYIPNGVEKAKRRAPAIIRDFGLEGGGYFLSVGRLVPEKRIEDLVKAFLAGPRRSKLVIVGGSAGTEEYVERLKEAAAGARNIIFAGYQFGDALAEFFSNALAFVTPSELEGLPLTLLEAMSYGLPCIISDIPPHMEVLDDHRFKFPVGDVRALSNLMNEIEGMEESELAAVGRHAVEIVERRFDWDGIADQIERLYMESLGEEAARTPGNRNTSKNE